MSPRPDHARVPPWRARVAAAELVGAAVLAHAAADGGLPGPEVVLVVTLVALGLTRAVRRHLLHPTAATLLAGAAQVGLHVVVTAVPNGIAGPGALHGTGHAAHHAGGHGIGHSVLDPAWVTPEMVLAHAAAGALTLLALLWQEDVVADLRHLLGGLRSDTARLPELRSWVPGVAPLVRSCRTFVTTAPRRGPPGRALSTG